MDKIFLWNFKGTLWNYTLNILPIHWKIRFLYTAVNLRTHRFNRSTCIFEMPPRSRQRMWWQERSFQTFLYSPLGRRHLTFGALCIFLKGHVSEMQYASHDGVDGQLLIVCHAHAGHSTVHDAEVSDVVQLDIVEAAVLQELWKQHTRSQRDGAIGKLLKTHCGLYGESYRYRAVPLIFFLNNGIHKLHPLLDYEAELWDIICEYSKEVI